MALKQDLQRIADEHTSRLDDLKQALSDNVPIRDSLRSASFELAAEQAYQLFDKGFKRAVAAQESAAEKLVKLSAVYATHVKALRSVFSAATEKDIIEQNLRAMFEAYKAIYPTA
jgi:hypothetical protein